jgi:hypothetical protein
MCQQTRPHLGGVVAQCLGEADKDRVFLCVATSLNSAEVWSV